MKDIQTIKKRLAAIQGNFNPQKNTYQVIEHVVNNDLNYNEMLLELSKIKGFSKYPDDLKKEYISIINDIKENIINQRKKAEREKQAANTKELKDIIDSLERRKKEYIKQLDNITKETEITESPSVESKSNEDSQIIEENVKTIEDNKALNEKENNVEEDDKEQLDKIKKVLLIGIVIVILLITAVLLFY